MGKYAQIISRRFYDDNTVDYCYNLLASIFREEDLRGIPLERFEHLIELEIVKLSDQGIEPANGGIILTIGTLSESGTDKVPINDAVDAVNDAVNNSVDVVNSDDDVVNDVVNSDDDVVNDVVNGDDDVVNDVVNGDNDVVNDVVNRQKQIVQAIKNNPDITIEQISLAIGVSKSTIDRELRKMKGKTIERSGPDKSGYWVILNS